MRAKHWTLLAVAVAGLISAPPPAVGRQPEGQPQLKLSQEEWDFGTAIHLQKLHFDLVATNVGTGVLRISKVKTSCGCTAAEPEKYVLQPGESTTIKVTFNTWGKRGKVDYLVTILSNDPAHPEREFRVRGFVKRVIKLTPEFGTLLAVLDPAQRQTQTVRMINTSSEPMRPKVLPFPSGRFTAQLREIRPGQEYEIVLATNPPIAEHTWMEKLIVETGLADEPRIELPVHYRVIDRVSLVPPAVYVGDPDQPTQRNVRVQYYGDDPDFRVLRAVCEDPQVRIDLSGPRAPSVIAGGLTPKLEIVLQLAFPAGVRLPPEGLLFRVYTSDPEYPELRFRATADGALYAELTRQARATSQRKKTP